MIKDCRSAIIRVSEPTMPEPSLKQRIFKEAALFGSLFLFGLAILPLAIYLVGDLVFGAYEGRGFADFYGRLHAEFRAGEPAVVFLMLAPYLLWQLLRLAGHLFRHLQPSTPETR